MALASQLEPIAPIFLVCEGGRTGAKAPEDLRPCRGGECELVVTWAGERVNRRIVMRVIGRECGDCHARVESDQPRH